MGRGYMQPCQLCDFSQTHTIGVMFTHNDKNVDGAVDALCSFWGGLRQLLINGGVDNFLPRQSRSSPRGWGFWQ